MTKNIQQIAFGVIKRIARDIGVKEERLSYSISEETPKGGNGTKTEVHVRFDGRLYDYLSWDGVYQEYREMLESRAKGVGYGMEDEDALHILLYKRE